MADKLTNQTQEMVDAIRREVETAGRPLRVMEVCGTHTVAIYRNGLHTLLKDGIDFLSGPGCPVCVTHHSFIDQAVALSMERTIYTFGDLLRVPGSAGSLDAARGRGGKVKIMLSPLDAVEQASRSTEPSVVAAVGFETTAPAFALAVDECRRRGMEHVLFLNELKTMPAPMRFLLNAAAGIDGLILPGHVATVIGVDGFRFIEPFGVPSVIAGFTGENILAAMVRLLRKINRRDAAVENGYGNVVRQEGNPVARQAVDKVFEPAVSWFRGIGPLEGAGLKMRAGYRHLEIPVEYHAESDTACRCADILTGKAKPADCPLFGTACIPEHPHGSCMVSSEGSCAAYYKYGRDGRR